MALDALSDPVFLGILAVLVLIFFLGYLFIHRTIVEFHKGLERDRGR